MLFFAYAFARPVTIPDESIAKDAINDQVPNREEVKEPLSVPVHLPRTNGEPRFHSDISGGELLTLLSVIFAESIKLIKECFVLWRKKQRKQQKKRQTRTIKEESSELNDFQTKS
jgi:hypothetical protein